MQANNEKTTSTMPTVQRSAHLVTWQLATEIDTCHFF